MKPAQHSFQQVVCACSMGWCHFCLVFTVQWVYYDCTVVVCLFIFSSKRLHTLLQALTPSLLRVGGSSADWLFFNKPAAVVESVGLRPEPSVVTGLNHIILKLTSFQGCNTVKQM